MQGLGDKKEFGTRPQRETVAFCAFGVATSADALSLGIGWDEMGLTG